MDCSSPQTSAKPQRHLEQLVFFGCLFLLTYFFQGGGWNQNSHLALIRSIVEQGSTELSTFGDSTGDVSIVNGKTFSNKAPGLALLGVIPYGIISFAESVCGVDLSATATVSFNAYILSILLSALPAAYTALLLLRVLISLQIKPAFCAACAIFFAIGTMSLPYAGALITGNLLTCALFMGWYFLFFLPPDKIRPLLGASALGIAAIVDYSALPLAILLVAYFCFKAEPTIIRKAVVGFTPWILLLAFYQLSTFGSIFAVAYEHTDQQFKAGTMIFGLFALPRFEVLYYLTFHPMKGLFFLSPFLVCSLFSVLQLSREDIASRSVLTAGLICGFFFAVNLSIATWTAGWGVGPRYIFPILPFLTVAASNVVHRLSIARATFIVLGVYSALLNVTVAAVGTFIPFPLTYPPEQLGAEPFTPISWIQRWLQFDLVSVNTQNMLEKFPTRANPSSLAERWDSFNLGELIGLTGSASVVPFFLVLLGVTLQLKHAWKTASQQHQ